MYGYLPSHADWPKRKLLRSLTALILLATTLVVAPLPGTPSAGAATVNPNLDKSCGLDVTLILDESGSMAGTRETSTEAAALAFVNALANTGSQVRIIKFDAAVNSVSALTPAENVSAGDLNITPSGLTNWNAALGAAAGANATPLTIILTDGNPTTGGDGTTGASALRDDSHIFAVGIELSGTTATNNLIAISGPDAYSGPSSDFGTIDYAINVSPGALATLLEDFVRDLCGGSINIHKTEIPAAAPNTPTDGADWEFAVTLPADDDTVWEDPITGSTTTNPTATDDTDSTGNANFKWQQDGGTLTANIVEKGQDGWTFTSATCTKTTIGGNPTPVPVTPATDNDGDTTWTVSGIGEFDVVNCEVVNTEDPPKATLTLVKEMKNDNGGTAAVSAWTLTADGPDSNDLSGVTATAAVTDVEVDPGTYALGETGPANYTGTWVCLDAAGGAVAVTNDAVTLAANDDVTCTVTNDDDAPSLTLTKVVGQGEGVTVVPADFLISATLGGDVVSGQGSAASGPDFKAGTYQLAESGPTLGYTGTWSCPGATMPTPTSVTVGLGESVACTITNTPNQATITLNKTVSNNYGGDLDAADFQATLQQGANTAVNVDWGTPINVAPGAYTADELAVAGYEAGDWSGDCAADGSITITVGQAATCTITNSDLPSTLTLTKVVDNLGETGPALKSASDFTLTANIDGDAAELSGAGGDTSSTLAAGDYVLGETADANYSGVWECVGGTVDNDTVTVPLNGNVTCTLTNTLIVDDSIAITKELLPDSQPDGDDSDGDILEYRLTATLSGNVVRSVEVTDSLTGDSAVCGAVAPGGTCVLDVSYVLQQSDIDSGSLSNTGRACINVDECDESTVDLPFTPAPDLTIEKVVTSPAPREAVTTAGQVIEYQITVGNGGNITLTNVTVTDDLADTLSCPSDATPDTDAVENIGSLIPGASEICTATYTVTQLDLDGDNGNAVNGQLINTAVADSEETEPVDDDALVETDAEPALKITKVVTSPTPPTVMSAGDVITYTITVENDGDRTVNNVVVTDNLADTLTCPGDSTVDTDAAEYLGSLAPTDAAVVCTATYTVTQPDVDGTGNAVGGELVNTATADSDETDPVEAQATVDVQADTELTIVKSVTSPTPPTVMADGDEIEYSILVSNDGDTTLNNVVVTDSLADSLTCPGAEVDTDPDSETLNSLAPGASVTCTAMYTVTQADIDGTSANVDGDGNLTNIATADSDETDPVDDKATVDVDGNTELGFTKSVESITDPDVSNSVTPGDVVTYQLVATNNGDTTLTEVTIVDPMLGTLGCTPTQPATLLPTASMTCTGTYEIQEGDVGTTVRNTATADSEETEEVTATADVVVPAPPAEKATIRIKKRAFEKGGTFSFGGDLGPITLSPAANTYVFEEIEVDADTTYTVYEIVPQGWDLEAISCFGPGSEGDWSVNLAEASATITPDPGDVISCLWDNRPNYTPPVKTAKINVKKWAHEEGGTFSFGTPVGTVNISVGADQYKFETIEVEAGKPAVLTEYVPKGWELEYITCWDTAYSNWSANVAAASVTVTPAADEHLTCMFSNRPTDDPKPWPTPEPSPSPTPEPQPMATIAIKKLAQGDSGVFQFGGDLGDFRLKAIEGKYVRKEFQVPAGTYRIGEKLAEGWDLADINCFGDGYWVENLDKDRVKIDVAAGQEVTCVFTNKVEPVKPQPEPAKVQEKAEDNEAPKEHIQPDAKIVDQPVEDDDNGDDGTVPVVDEEAPADPAPVAEEAPAAEASPTADEAPAEQADAPIEAVDAAPEE